MQRLLWQITVVIVRFILKAFAHFEVKGLENLENLEPPLIVIANHTSYLDPVALGAAISPDSELFPIRFLTKKEVYLPILGQLLKGLAAIQIDQKNPLAGLKTALGILRQGGTIGVFPEGKRSLDGKLAKFHPGIEFLVQRSGATVVPVIINGTFKRGEGSFAGLKKVIFFLSRQYRIQVTFGPAIINDKVEEEYRKFYQEVS